MLIILFSDDSAKNMELHLLVLRERKNIFLARQISARQHGTVMAFIPDPVVCISQCAPLGALDGRENFNSDIIYQEVEAAIQKIKAGKSPGLDSFYPELFQNAGDSLKKAILYIFNISWIEGQLPSTWKSANVKFLPKQVIRERKWSSLSIFRRLPV